MYILPFYILIPSQKILWKYSYLDFAEFDLYFRDLGEKRQARVIKLPSLPALSLKDVSEVMAMCDIKLEGIKVDTDGGQGESGGHPSPPSSVGESLRKASTEYGGTLTNSNLIGIYCDSTSTAPIPTTISSERDQNIYNSPQISLGVTGHPPGSSTPATGTVMLPNFDYTPLPQSSSNYTITPNGNLSSIMSISWEQANLSNFDDSALLPKSEVMDNQEQNYLPIFGSGTNGPNPSSPDGINQEEAMYSAWIGQPATASGGDQIKAQQPTSSSHGKSNEE